MPGVHSDRGAGSSSMPCASTWPAMRRTKSPNPWIGRSTKSAWTTRRTNLFPPWLAAGCGDPNGDLPGRCLAGRSADARPLRPRVSAACGLRSRRCSQSEPHLYRSLRPLTSIACGQVSLERTRHQAAHVKSWNCYFRESIWFLADNYRSLGTRTG